MIMMKFSFTNFLLSLLVLSKLTYINFRRLCHSSGGFSRRVPPATSLIQSQDKSCGLCGAQNKCHWDRFSPIISGFPRQYSFHQMIHIHL
jgi:hypothetical protein